MQPLQCDSRLSDAKHNSITLAAAAASNLDAAIPLRAADTELQSATAPQIAAILQLQNWISTPKRKNDDFEALFTRNFKRLQNTLFRANPNIKIASMIHANEAFVRGVLQIARVEDMKTKLSCEASFDFHELKK